MVSPSEIRLGFVGCGHQAVDALMPNTVAAPEIDFVAVCDLEATRLARAAHRFHTAAYADFCEMIRQEALDAVFICGPPDMHHQVGIECLKLGVHILVEKPPATTADQAQELADAARDAGRFGMVATMWRHEQIYRIMKEQIDHEAFGRPMLLDAQYVAPGPTDELWGSTDTFLNYLRGQIVHLCDCTRFLVGDVTEVYCAGMAAADGGQSMSVTLRFACGATGTWALASNTGILQTLVAVQGERGRIIEVENGQRLRMAGDRETWAGTAGGYRDVAGHTWDYGWSHPGWHRSGFLEEQRHFAKCILNNKQPRASLDDGVAAMRLLEAINESRLEGMPVTL